MVCVCMHVLFHSEYKQIVRLGIHNDTNLGDAPVVADFSDRYGGRGTATAEDRQVGGLWIASEMLHKFIQGYCAIALH